MLGNVSEWTIDWYYPYVENDVLVDPVNLRIFDNINTGRIHRGGNVTQGSNKTSCSYREYSLPSTCSKYIGFRCCLPIN
jgi:formylglycine-generating enzyme required for sulfatase activity